MITRLSTKDQTDQRTYFDDLRSIMGDDSEDNKEPLNIVDEGG